MIKLQKNISLKPYTTFKIGGRAEFFLKAKTKNDLLRAVSWANKNKIHLLLLGEGSNILLTKDFDGLVILNRLEKISKNKCCVIAESGVLMRDLLSFCLKNNLQGLEWSAGLPGTLGGAVRGNAGAFGGEIKDSIVEVELLCAKGKDIKMRLRKKNACRFSYRSSILKSNNEIILSAKLKLKKTKNIKPVEASAKQHISYRKKFQPLEYPNAGSVFKNIPLKSVDRRVKKIFKKVVKKDPFPVIPAAAVIDKLKLKGKSAGGAQISQKHPNFIINKNNASAYNIIKLMQLMKTKVKKKFDINLEEEIQII